MTKARDIADFKFENITDTGTEGTKVATGTTAQRGSTTGQWRYNTTTGFFEGRNTNGTFSTLEPAPSIASTDVTEIDTDTGGNITIRVTGTNFATGGTIKFIANDNTEITASTSTFINTANYDAVVSRSSFTNAKEPYDVKYVASSGVTAILENNINVDNAPSWTTSAGNLGSVVEGTNANIIVSATDSDGDSVAYSETTGNLAGAGFSLDSSTGAITGTASAVSGDTTTSFTLRATAGSKTTDRDFNIITKNVNVDALLFDATNLNSTGTDVYTSNTDGASVGLTLNNGNAISVNTAVQLSRINGITDGTGTLANGAMLPNHSNLLSHYNSSNTKNYGNSFWSMVKGDTHNTNYNNAWMGIYNGGSQTNAHVWWTWDLGDNPSVKLKRMTNDWTWRTGSATFYVYGSNSIPNGGSNMTSSFVTTGLTLLLQDGSLGATEDNTLSNTDYYRYYVLRLQSTGNPYDFGFDRCKWYGDYY